MSLEDSDISFNNLNHIMPTINTNTSYNRHPITTSPGTNNQMPSTINKNPAVAGDSITNSITNSLNSSITYSILGATQTLITTNNMSKANGFPLGKVILILVKLQNKSITSSPSFLSYLGKHDIESTTNFFKVPKTNNQTNSPFVNQQMNITPVPNHVKIFRINSVRFNVSIQ